MAFAMSNAMRNPLPAASVGLGLRRGLLDAIEAAPAGQFDFLECAPENWLRVGGASVSTKHAGFIVNDQNATAAEIRTLIETVQNKVEEKFGVRLMPEVRFLGEF